MFRKIFARKAQDIVNKIEKGESILYAAEQTLIALKNASKAKILKEEILNLLDDYIFAVRTAPREMLFSGTSEISSLDNNLKAVLQELFELAEGKEKAENKIEAETKPEAEIKS